MRERKKHIRDQDRGVSKLLLFRMLYLLDLLCQTITRFTTIATGVSHMPHYSVKVKNVLCRSQSWLLSVLLGGSLEGFFLPVFLSILLSNETIVCDLEFSAVGRFALALCNARPRCLNVCCDVHSSSRLQLACTFPRLQCYHHFLKQACKPARITPRASDYS